MKCAFVLRQSEQHTGVFLQNLPKGNLNKSLGSLYPIGFQASKGPLGSYYSKAFHLYNSIQKATIPSLS